MLNIVETSAAATTTTASARPLAPKQINILNNIAANTTMYTVPSGRKFVGRIFNTSSNASTYIDNTAVYANYSNPQGYLAAAASRVVWTFLPGTVIREGTSGSTSQLIGIEQDLNDNYWVG